MNITKEQLALKFHETYERLAPEFGYETRSDTKKFDPESNNGRLMIAVCEAIMRGLEDAAPVNRCITELLAFAKDHPGTYIFPSWDGSRVMKYLATSPQAAQTESKLSDGPG